MKNLILASASPRRQELLKLLEKPFQIVTANIDESFADYLDPVRIVQELSLKKAEHVAKQGFENQCVIGADTIVVYKDEILGKPKSALEAKEMLEKLSGQRHQVYTGLSLVRNNESKTFYEKTSVLFWELTEEEIASYVSSGEPFDKAGGYGIQGHGAKLVKSIKGDYYNVVGLPLGRLQRELAAFLKEK